jgi:hypothetical protein
VIGNFVHDVTLANGTRLPSGIYVISYSNNPHNHDLIAAIDPTIPSDQWIMPSLSPCSSKTVADSAGSTSSSASSMTTINEPGADSAPETETVEISRSQTLHLRHQLNELASLLCAEGSGIHYSNLLYVLRHIYDTKGSTLGVLRQTIDGLHPSRKKRTAAKKRKDYEGNSDNNLSGGDCGQSNEPLHSS